MAVGRLAIADAEDRQAHAADRACYPPAVEHELLEALVADPVDVHAHALDQLSQRARGQREATIGVGQGGHDLVRAGAGYLERSQRCGLGVEPAQLLLVREGAVADVVDAAREGVDRAHRATPLAGEQADAVEEVRRLLARDRFAVRIGAGDVDLGAHRPLRSRSSSVLASASSLRRLPERGGPGRTS